jgi:hypothetical protein
MGLTQDRAVSEGGSVLEGICRLGADGSGALEDGAVAVEDDPLSPIRARGQNNPPKGCLYGVGWPTSQYSTGWVVWWWSERMRASKAALFWQRPAPRGASVVV